MTFITFYKVIFLEKTYLSIYFHFNYYENIDVYDKYSIKLCMF